MTRTISIKIRSLVHLTRFRASLIPGTAALFLLTATACDKQASPPPARTSAPQSADQDLQALREKVVSEPGSAALPPNHPPIGGQAAPSSSPAQDGMPPNHPPVGAAPRPAAPFAAMSAAPPVYEVPETWQTQQPRSTMRKAQYALPGADGTGDGDMVLFYFGQGEGGDIESNLDRWKKMFTTADGQPVPEGGYKVERLSVGDLKVTTLDIAGTYREPPMMNPQAAAPRPEHRMLCAIVEMPNGNWFFKGTGPSATMAQHESAFRKLVQSLKAK